MRDSLFLPREILLFSLLSLFVIVLVIPTDYQLGRSFFLSYDFEKAYKYLSTSLPTQHQDPEILISLANYFEKIGDNEKAVELWQNIVILLPKSKESYRKLITLMSWIGKELDSLPYQEKLNSFLSPRDQIYNELDIARKYNYYQDFESANLVYERLLKSSDNAVIDEASEYFCRHKNIPKCIESINLMQKNKFSISKEEQLAFIYLSLRKTEDSIQAIQNVIGGRLNSTWEDVWSQKGEIFYQKFYLLKLCFSLMPVEDVKKILPGLKKMFELGINRAEFVFEYFEILKNYDKAQLFSALNFYVEHGKIFSPMILPLAQNYRFIGKQDKAISLLELELNAGRASLEIMEELVDLYEETTQDEKAIELIRKIMKSRQMNVNEKPQSRINNPLGGRRIAAVERDYRLELKLARIYVKNKKEIELKELVDSLLQENPNLLDDQQWQNLIFYGLQNLKPDLAAQAGELLLGHAQTSEERRDVNIFLSNQYKEQGSPEKILSMLGDQDLNPIKESSLFYLLFWAIKQTGLSEKIKKLCYRLINEAKFHEGFYYENLYCLEKFHDNADDTIAFLEQYHKMKGHNLESLDLLFHKYISKSDFESAKQTLEKIKTQFQDNKGTTEKEIYLNYLMEEDIRKTKNHFILKPRFHFSKIFSYQQLNMEISMPQSFGGCFLSYSRTGMSKPKDTISDYQRLGCQGQNNGGKIIWELGAKIYLQEHENNNQFPILLGLGFNFDRSYRIKFDLDNLHRDLEYSQSQNVPDPFYRKYSVRFISEHKQMINTATADLLRPTSHMGNGSIWELALLSEFTPILKISPLSFWSLLQRETIEGNNGIYSNFMEDTTKVSFGPRLNFKDLKGNEFIFHYGQGRRLDKKSKWNSENKVAIQADWRVTDLGRASIYFDQVKSDIVGELTESQDFGVDFQHYF